MVGLQSVEVIMEICSQSQLAPTMVSGTASCAYTGSPVRLQPITVGPRGVKTSSGGQWFQSRSTSA